MNYLINESKLNDLVIKFLNVRFPPDKIYWDHPIVHFTDYDEWGNTDIVEKRDETIKRYFFGGNNIFLLDLYYPKRNSIKVDYFAAIDLNNLFGQQWMEPFKIWFEDNFGHKITYVSVE